MSQSPCCLSADVHDRRIGKEKERLSSETIDNEHITNPVVHYFGCLPFCERRDYFDLLNCTQKERIRDELRRVLRLRKFITTSELSGACSTSESKTSPGECHGGVLVKNVEDSFKTWREHCNSDVECKLFAAKLRAYKEKQHPWCQGGCRNQFEPIASKPPTLTGEPTGIDPCEASSSSQHSTPNDTSEYDPDKDIKAYLVQFTKGKDDRVYKTPELSNEGDDGQCENVLSPPEKQRRAVWRGKFPAQKAMVYDLLSDVQGTNYLSSEYERDNASGESSLRYFHFPANNMQWVEQAIAKYYSPQKPEAMTDREPTRKQEKQTPTPAETLLRHELWRGQQHKSSTVHGRHLHPICELASAKPDTAESTPNNIVLFMPILHWDTDRKRHTFAQAIDNLTAKERRRKATERDNETDRRRRERRAILEYTKSAENEPTTPGSCRQVGSGRSPRPMNNVDSLSEAVLAHAPGDRQKFSGMKRDENGRLKLKHPLAQLLYDVSHLMEAIENYRDIMMLEKYLHKSAPLHPRRTLDQAYYCSLKNTQARDRDQVVYRETAPKPDGFHQWEYAEGNLVRWTCRDLPDKIGDVKKPRHPPTEHPNLRSRMNIKLKWRCRKCFSAKRHRKRWWGKKECPRTEECTTDEEELSKEEMDGRWCQACGSAAICCKFRCKEAIPADNPSEGEAGSCSSCRDNISKLPRLVMVDQLWMWILNGHTILTFFPRRYGFNRHDLSGIHRSIRSRLENSREPHIRTIYDLALIILNECTKPFFGHTRTLDRQPQVLDLFSEAIGRVTYQQTLAFQHLWDSAEKLRKASSAPTEADLSELHIPLLNIAPEGMLQKEIKDILDELNIMIHLVKQQKDILDKFKKNVVEMEDRQGKQEQVSRENGPGGASETKANLWRFERAATKLISNIDGHLDQLSNLRESATSTSQSLDQLLTLKQQQTSVIQAWQSIRHGEEAVVQGRAIMIFTTMTIFFLPLGFIAALFGMNNPQLDSESVKAAGKEPMSFGSQLKWICIGSVCTAMSVMILAYSAFTRALFSSALQRSITWLATRLWIYRVWVEWRQQWASESQWRRTEEYVGKRKAREHKAVRRRFAMKVKEERELREKRRKKQDEYCGDSQSRENAACAQLRHRESRLGETHDSSELGRQDSLSIGGSHERTSRVGGVMEYLAGKWQGDGISSRRSQDAESV